MTDLAALILAEAAGGDLASAGFRLAWRTFCDDIWAGVDKAEARGRFDEIRIATKQLIDQQTT